MKDSTLDSAPAQRSAEPENFSNRKLIRPSLTRNDHGHGGQGGGGGERRERPERGERGGDRGR